MRRWGIGLFLSTWLAWGLLLAQEPNADHRAATPARWLPASTLTYVEFSSLQSWSKELGLLLYDSPLADYPFKLQAHRENPAPTALGRPGLRPSTSSRSLPEWLEPVALACNSDVQPEMARLGPLALATVPLHENQVGFVGILPLGGSTLPRLWLRQYLANKQTEPGEVIEGINTSLVTSHAQAWDRAHRLWQDFPGRPPGQPQQPMDPRRQTDGAVAFALVQDAIVWGTPEAVALTVRLAQKPNAQPLATTPRFREARAKAPAQGAFIQVRVPQAARRGSLPPGSEDVGWLDQLHILLGSEPPSLLQGSMQLRNKRLTFSTEGVLPGSLLQRAVGTSPVSTEILHYAPANSFAALAWSNAEGERRWGSLREVLGHFLSDVPTHRGSLRQRVSLLMQGGAIDLASELAPNVTNAAWAMVAGENPQSPTDHLLVLECRSDEKAQRLLDHVAPLVVSNWVGQAIAPTIKEWHGQTVHEYDLSADATIAIGRQQRFVVVGAGERVAKSLADAKARRGLLANPVIQAELQDAKEANAIAVARTWPTLLLLAADRRDFTIPGPDGPGLAGLPFAGPPGPQPAPGVQIVPVPDGVGPRNDRPGANGQPQPAAGAGAKTPWQYLMEAANVPAVGWLRVQGSKAALELRIPDAKPGLAETLRFWLENGGVQPSDAWMPGRSGFPPGRPQPNLPGGPQPAQPPVLPPPPRDR